MGYADAAALFADSAIDIVTVAVSVPAHRELVLGALAAGKHIYCEYPLGRDLAEAEELAAAARIVCVHVAVGLQLHASAAARRARALIEAGAIGRVLSARILSTPAAFGPTVEAALAFAEKPENGVTLATIQGAHTIDLATAVLGDFADLTALGSTQYPQVTVEGGRPQPRITPDHLAVTARLAGGAPVLIEVAGGRPAEGTPFRFEVTGETGVLVLEGGALRGVQSGVLRLLVDGKEQPVAAGPVAEPGTAVNVAALYAALRDDILNGTATAPDFGHAVRAAQLLDDALASSASGKRETLAAPV